ncbi:MAG: hypothetical protein ACPLRN_02790 [Microgenomates group bacterium]
MSERDQSFLSSLFKKLADTMRIQEETKKPTTAAQNEVWRQIGQTSREKGGNPITGKGVTKSGQED